MENFLVEKEANAYMVGTGIDGQSTGKNVDAKRRVG